MMIHYIIMIMLEMCQAEKYKVIQKVSFFPKYRRTDTPGNVLHYAVLQSTTTGKTSHNRGILLFNFWSI